MRSTAVDPAGVAPVAHIEVVRPTAAVEVPTEATVECTLSMADKPWVGGFNEFSAPTAEKDAFPGLNAAGHVPLPDSVFLGRAVGSVHEPTSVKFWKETFEKDIYVENILRHGYKIPVKLSVEEATKTYREKNNKSARDEMPYVRAEVKRLVESGQVIQVNSAPDGQLLGRIMRPILRKLSEMGIRNVMYVDDGWVVASSKEKADADYAIALFYFKRAGFIVAVEKSEPDRRRLPEEGVLGLSH
jgi:hypothetical protein